MLYLFWKTRGGKKKEIIWHIGEPMPILDIRVVTFQADGHELEMIVEAMKNTRHKPLPICPRCKNNMHVECGTSSYMCKNCDTSFIPE